MAYDTNSARIRDAQARLTCIGYHPVRTAPGPDGMLLQWWAGPGGRLVIFQPAKEGGYELFRQVSDSNSIEDTFRELAEWTGGSAAGMALHMDRVDREYEQRTRAEAYALLRDLLKAFPPLDPAIDRRELSEYVTETWAPQARALLDGESGSAPESPSLPHRAPHAQDCTCNSCLDDTERAMIEEYGDEHSAL
jgi:hypothetical protein